ncbi:MAG: sulfatase/phosphatase domain-containing protein, partial [Bacteroidales bacterium]
DTLISRAIFWHYPHYSNQGGKPGAAIRLGSYKLIEFFEDNRVELYDLSADPGEKNNLASHLTAERDRLLKMLHRWQVSTGARGMDPNPDFNPEYVKNDIVSLGKK